MRSHLPRHVLKSCDWTWTWCQNLYARSRCFGNWHWCDLASHRRWTFWCKRIPPKIRTDHENLDSYRTGDFLSTLWTPLYRSHTERVFSNWQSFPTPFDGLGMCRLKVLYGRRTHPAHSTTQSQVADMTLWLLVGRDRTADSRTMMVVNNEWIRNGRIVRLMGAEWEKALAMDSTIPMNMMMWSSKGAYNVTEWTIFGNIVYFGVNYKISFANNIFWKKSIV